jgi:methyl-accepting chemotaxis protein
VAEGDFSYEVEIEANNQLGSMANNLNKAIDSLNFIINQFEKILSKVANGDFTEKVNVKVGKELEEMARNLNQAIDSLRDVIYGVKQNAVNVNNLSTEIAELSS